VPQTKLLRPPRYKSKSGTLTFLTTGFDLPFLKFIEVLLHKMTAETSAFRPDPKALVLTWLHLIADPSYIETAIDTLLGMLELPRHHFL